VSSRCPKCGDDRVLALTWLRRVCLGCRASLREDGRPLAAAAGLVGVGVLVEVLAVRLGLPRVSGVGGSIAFAGLLYGALGRRVRIERDGLTCVGCGYDLSGVVGRCPECGGMP
jgi:hypothetical protein